MKRLNNDWEYSSVWTDEFLTGDGYEAIVRLPHDISDAPLHYSSPTKDDPRHTSEELFPLRNVHIHHLFAGVKRQQLVAISIFPAGMQAVIAIFGIAWMGDTFINGNITELTASIEGIVTEMPWL